MTCCIALRVREGLLGIADTRVTSGSECITARKVSTFTLPDGVFFIMTSGLRSVRDKALIYFEDELHFTEPPPDRLYKAVNLLAEQVRRVAAEDKHYLEESGIPFSSYILIGGQLSCDRTHHLYMIYPQGNWVEVGPGTPYSIIGSGGYGKPVLDRTLTFDDSLEFAFKVGCLAFDSTRISAADVDFPIDTVLFRTGSGKIIEHRYEAEDLQEVTSWWQNNLRGTVGRMPSDWTSALLKKEAGGG